MPVAAQEKRPVKQRPFRRLISRVFSFPALLTLLVLVSPMFISDGFHSASYVFSDEDIWWHLHNAQRLFAEHHAIQQDAYTYTVAGKAWLNPEAGAELPYYFAWRMFGLPGIYYVSLAVTCALAGGILLLCYLRSRSVKTSVVPALLGVLLLSASMGPRTILFGWCLFIAELVLLELHRQGRDHLWLLPLLFMLWINVHASYLVGMVYFAMYVAAGLLDGTWGKLEARRWASAERPKLFAIVALSLAGIFINPYGWRLVFYPLDVAFHQKLTTSYIQEWQSLQFSDPRAIIAFGILGAMFLLSLTSSRRWALHDALFWMLAFYGAFTHMRFVVLVGIVVCPMLAGMLPRLPYAADRDRPSVAAPLLFGLAALFGAFLPNQRAMEGVLRQHYPAGALQWLRAHPSGRVFNAFEWGGYLNFRDPQLPVFMDGRMDVFDHAGILADYIHATSLQDSLAILDRYRVQAVLMPGDAPLIYLLQHSEGWRFAYRDSVSVLLQRQQPFSERQQKAPDASGGLR